MESTAEGEAQRYFDHALTLKNTILFLRYNKELTQDQGPDIPNIGRYNVTILFVGMQGPDLAYRTLSAMEKIF